MNEKNQLKFDLCQLVRSIYDLQKLRIQIGNRIVANFRFKLGQDPGKPTSDIKDQGQKILREVLRDYRRMTDGVIDIPWGKLIQAIERHNGVISSSVEANLVQMYLNVLTDEERGFKRLQNDLKQFEIWNGFLKDIRGIGPAMGGVIISELDPHAAPYPSSFWKYCGLDVVEGEGRSKRKNHLVPKVYIDSEGNKKETHGISFNPFIKTKLTGVLGPSFLRLGKNKYSEIYYDYRNRLESNPFHEEKTKLHKHNMAIRYMIKIFLIDLWTEWRKQEGLEVKKPYHEEKLGLIHRQKGGNTAASETRMETT